MPTYKITDPQTGRNISVTGDSPPTESELNDIFSAAQSRPGLDLGGKARIAANAVADAAPIGVGILGGLGGTIAGAGIGALAGGVGAVPGGIAGSAVGTAAGTGAGGLLKSNIKSLLGTPMTQEENFNAAITQPAIAGATDAAFGVTGSVASKALKPVAKVLGETIPEGLMGNVFKEPLKETRSAVKSALMKTSDVSNLGKEALKRGEKGSAEEIFLRSAKELDTLENSLQTLLDGGTQTVPMSKIKETAFPYITELKKAGNIADADSIINRIKNIEMENGAEISVAEANKIKRTLYDEARNGYGKLASESVEGIKTIARGFKEGIEEALPQVKGINKELSYHGKVIDAMTDRIARVGRNEMLSLKNATVLAGGIASAPLTYGMSLLPAVGMVAGGTTQGLTTTAQLLSKIPQVAKAVEPVVKYGKNIISPMVSSEINKNMSGGAGGGSGQNRPGLDIQPTPYPKYLYK